MNDALIFTVTALHLDLKTGEILDARCVGYSFSYADAIDAVRHNNCDIFETCYNYVVVENVPPGFYPTIQFETWYMWDYNKKEYVLCAKPKCLENTCNYGIG